MAKHYNVLFLCSGNSARSIMAEALLNKEGFPNFAAYSAGRRPSGKIRPEALHQLEISGLSTFGFRSKSWDEFVRPDSPEFDFIFTVCDNAASETCPVWPGHPVTAHWGILNPAAVQGTPDEIERAFKNAFVELERRIDLFLALPLASLDQLELESKLSQIANS